MVEGKINKYGFIHVSKNLYEAANLPRKVDIPVTIEYQKEAHALIVKLPAREEEPRPVIETEEPAKKGSE